MHPALRAQFASRILTCQTLADAVRLDGELASRLDAETDTVRALRYRLEAHAAPWLFPALEEAQLALGPSSFRRVMRHAHGTPGLWLADLASRPAILVAADAIAAGPVPPVMGCSAAELAASVRRTRTRSEYLAVVEAAVVIARASGIDPDANPLRTAIVRRAALLYLAASHAWLHWSLADELEHGTLTPDRTAALEGEAASLRDAHLHFLAETVRGERTQPPTLQERLDRVAVERITQSPRPARR